MIWGDGVKHVVDKTLDTIIYDAFGIELVLKCVSAKGIEGALFASTSEVYSKSKAVPFKKDTDLEKGVLCLSPFPIFT